MAYLTVLTGAAWIATRQRRSRRKSAAEANMLRFAVLVPAHDEEQVIGATLDALARVDDPADLVRVHVVADHCTDATEQIARAAGVEVHRPDGSVRGKGPALQWAVEKLLGSDAGSEPPDVFVVIDADTIVHPAFFRELADAFATGAQVVQGQYRVRNPETSPGAGLRAAALAARHHLRPLGRTAIGASSGLYGNGMAFRAETLRGRRWTGHLTEDLELQMELLLDGVLVAYAPDAVVEAEMPATMAGARTQNERWERGRLELARRYVPKLIRAAATSRGRARIAAVDGVLDHLVPPLSVLAAGVAVTTVVSLPRPRRRRAAVGVSAALIGHVLSGLVMTRAQLAVYRSLLHAPRMVLWKVALWLRMLWRREGVEWVRTARAGSAEQT